MKLSYDTIVGKYDGIRIIPQPSYFFVQYEGWGVAVEQRAMNWYASTNLQVGMNTSTSSKID